MPVDPQKLRRLYADPLTQSIVDWAVENPGDPEHDVNALETVVDTLEKTTHGTRPQIIDALQRLAKIGCGEFIIGRKGKPSRIRWYDAPEKLQAVATDASDHAGRPIVTLKSRAAPYPNLETCVRFFASSNRTWPDHVVAAARAGLWDDDVSAPEWATRLDRIERAHDRVRRGIPEPPPKPVPHKRA